MKIRLSKLIGGQIKSRIPAIMGIGFSAAVVLLAIGSNWVSAGKVSEAQDKATRLEASAAADHEIKFRTITGVDDSSDTISLTFDSGFDLSGLVLGDVDLFHGTATGLETEENVGNSAGADRWGFELSGQVITLTAPTDAAVGEINASEYVVIKLGMNAAGGVNQITNPGTAGIYSIGINGQFGEVGAVYIPIIDNDEVTISATVPAVEEEEEEEQAGGGGLAAPDVIAPIITNIKIDQINSNSAVISWETDEPSIGRIEYGLDTTYSDSRTDLDNLFNYHQYQIKSLLQDTEYYLRVIVKDQAGNETVSVNYIFRTLAVGNVINFRAEGSDGRIDLNWQNPNMDNMAGIRIIRSEDGYAESPDQGLVIYEGPGQNFTDMDVINGQWYFYTNFVFDTSRQYGSGAVAEAVPLFPGQIIPPKPQPIDEYPEIWGGIEFDDLEFRVANETLRIYPDTGNNLSVLSETLLTILLDQQNVIKKLKTIIAQVGESSYLMKINESKSKYQTLISTPVEIGSYPMVVLIIVYEDGTKDTTRGNLIVENYGEINGAPISKKGEAKAGWYEEKVSGVKITLFIKNELDNGTGGEDKNKETGNWKLETVRSESENSEGKVMGVFDIGDQPEKVAGWQEWDGAKYVQYNPQVTGEDGKYGFMVPNGRYYLALEKDGYKKSVTSEFEVTNHLINWDLQLDRMMEKKRWYDWWWVMGIPLLFIIWWKRRKREEEERRAAMEETAG